MNPSYYNITVKGVTFDVMDIVGAMGVTFPVGLALKYLVRAGRKDGATYLGDIEKAIVCLQREAEIYKALAIEE